MFVRENASYSPVINALIAMAHEGGPVLLAAWHRDRRTTLEVGRGAPDAEAWQRGIATGAKPWKVGGGSQMRKHERKAKRAIEKAGFRVPSDVMLTAGSI